MKTILLDIGGTFIKCSDGRKIHIESAGSEVSIASSLKAALGDASRAAIAIPGPFDFHNGVFLMKHKFAAVYGKSFAEVANSGAELHFMHDVNAALLGAISIMGLENAALVTLGTGLGFSHCVNGIIRENAAGSPAKGIWDLPYGNSILEEAVSARGVSRAYAALGGTPGSSARKIADLAHGGNAAAAKAYKDMGAILGESLKPLREELSFDTLLVGGQVAKSLDLMIEPMQAALCGLKICPCPENAVFRGLETLLEKTN